MNTHEHYGSGGEFEFLPTPLVIGSKAATIGVKLWIAVCTIYAFMGWPLPIPIVNYTPHGGLWSAIGYLLIGGTVMYLVVRVTVTAIHTVLHRLVYPDLWRAHQQRIRELYDRASRPIAGRVTE
ncbi:MAG: hypothetical protein ACRDRR_00590 [Pseudonocardiaceae bacterium]